MISVIEANFTIKTQEKEQVELSYTRFLNFYDKKIRFLIQAPSQDGEKPGKVIGKIFLHQLSKDNEPMCCKCVLEDKERGKKMEFVTTSKRKGDLEAESIRLHELIDNMLGPAYEKIREGSRGRHRPAESV
jgi:hypothetical protein